MPANAIDRRMPVRYSPEVALAICEYAAEGKTLVEIEEIDGMPTRKSIYQWLVVYPKFFDAFERAKEISAQSLEEEALGYARVLASANDFTGTKVQAYNYAMQQLRWSAARRDKVRYGQSTNVTTTVPITINTTLNLGQEGQGPAQDIQQSTYTIEASIGGPGIVEDADDSIEMSDVTGEVIDLTETASETPERAFGLPDEETQQLHNPPNGRPPKTRRRKGHKTAAGTRRTAMIYGGKSPDSTKPTDEDA